MSKLKSVALAASAASAAAFPGAGPATAADLPVKALTSPAWTPQWYFSAEGAALISNYSQGPGGIDPVISQSKLGSCNTGFNNSCDLFTDRSGSQPNRNIGWSGALSIGRDIDPATDWRLSGSFNGFNTNRSSAAISQVLQSGINSSGSLLSTGSELVTQTDGFRFATIDFDVGRKWSQGLLQMRTFAGLRAMGTDQTLNVSDSEAKGLAFSGTGSNFFSAQINNLSQTEGRSNYIGVGPRVGVEGYYGTTWGVVGAASAAVLGGWRYSTFDQSSSGAASFTSCSDTEGCTGPVPFATASAANQHHSVFAGVGDVAASLGVAWRPTPTATVEIGYRAEYFFNVRESFHFVNTSSLSGSAQFDQKKDVFINAPYVKAIFKF